jgi:hypothetical protein
MINRLAFHLPSSKRRRALARIGLGSPLQLLAGAARRVREQADREDCERLIHHFAALEHGQPDAALELMWRQPAREPAHDLLERLWKLPARQPRR